MASLLYFLLLVLLLPASLAWVARKLVAAHGKLASMVIIFLAAAAPAAWVFYATQQADGITRAASLYVVPGLFVFNLIPACIGFALADLPKRRS